MLFIEVSLCMYLKGYCSKVCYFAYGVNTESMHMYTESAEAVGQVEHFPTTFRWSIQEMTCLSEIMK